MRSRITSVQLSILDAKQSRAAALHRQLEALDDEVEELLEIEPGETVRAFLATDYVVDFLNGSFTPTQLAAKLGIEVEPMPPLRAGPRTIA